MKLLGSASKADPALICPAAAQLPQTEVPAWVREIGERNTAKHRYLELVARGAAFPEIDPAVAPWWEREPGLGIADPWEWSGPAAAAAGRGPLLEWVVFIGLGDGEPRVSAWGEREDLHDDIMRAPREPGLLGIADVVELDHEAGEAWVTDYKFGRPPQVEWSRQLGVLGWAVQELTGYRVGLRVEHPDSRGRARTRECWMDEARVRVDAAALNDAWSRGRLVADALAAGEPPPLWPGWWCKSKCYANCPNNPRAQQKPEE